MSCFIYSYFFSHNELSYSKPLKVERRRKSSIPLYKIWSMPNKWYREWGMAGSPWAGLRRKRAIVWKGPWRKDTCQIRWWDDKGMTELFKIFLVKGKKNQLIWLGWFGAKGWYPVSAAIDSLKRYFCSGWNAIVKLSTSNIQQVRKKANQKKGKGWPR